MQKFCPECGTPAGGEREGRFRAGALFAGRFRIVAALARGGMGEVYRAHDLELGQPVALKFLTALRSDERARQRLRNEVRLARQLAHANVCRVYDIGEANGELYLSMEYVDGEDLAALLKRIGRVPVDKGIEIARKLCAGLAAAHAKGVLHRDLKPANIMIDGSGEVRIMDFGIAAVASELDASEIRSGTPAYMAPEQLAGRQATAHSDLYALGLVLYELFTGKVPFEGRDPGDLQRQRESHPSTTPATLIPDLGPRVERTILRCLEPDPKLRPASALEVSASLPGGDPLAEALAAGETPSPEMVAASGASEGLSPPRAAVLLATVAMGLAAILAITPRSQVLTKLPLDHAPEVLVSKARDILRAFGHTKRPGDEAWGFRYDDAYLPYVESRLTATGAARATEWDAALANGPSPVVFWYLQSPDPLADGAPSPEPIGRTGLRGGGLISGADPQQLLLTELDLSGRLLRYESSGVPSSREVSPSSSPDWRAIFGHAGLDPARFNPAGTATDNGSAGAAAAWTGAYPGSLQLPVRLETERNGGTLTRVRLLFPWFREGAPYGDRAAQLRISTPALVLLQIGITIAAAVLARRNWRLGRADVSGARRLGVTAALSLCLFLGFGVHDPVRMMPSMIAWPVVAGVMTATVYLALEPWMRRFWPEMMIAWSRVAIGRWRDPLVARDILAGVTAATVNQLLQRGFVAGSTALGAAPRGPIDVDGQFGFVLENLGGQLAAVAVMGYALVRAITAATGFVLILLVLKMLLRKSALAVAALFLCLAGAYSVPWFVAGDVTTAALWLVEGSFFVVVLLRWGPLRGGHVRVLLHPD